MTTIFSLRKAARTVLLGAVVLGTAACSTIEGVLDVNNPGELDEGLLQDETLVNVLAAGVVGDFTIMYGDPFIWRGSMITDDQVSGINWEGTARLSQRLVRYDEGDADLMFAQISRARMQADSVSGRFKGGLVDNPTSNVNLARTLAFAGYSYIIMADAMCEATINVGDKLYQPVELYEIAAQRFAEALPIATAANNASLVNMINVGLSRAYLNQGKNAEAMAAATKVPANFHYWVEYNGSDTRTYNPLYGNLQGANHNMGIHPNFVAGGPDKFGTQGLDALLTDPRVQHDPKWTLGHNQSTPLYKPRQGLMWSEYNGQTIANGGKPAAYTRDADLALASYVEAMHNYYEAAGPTGTGPLGTTLDFVNSRRAVGNQAPVTLSGAALMEELSWQRGRDLSMAGFRLGDLRRWLRQGTDRFPKGQHANSLWQYGDATCFPLPKEEYEGNPNITDPNRG